MAINTSFNPRLPHVGGIFRIILWVILLTLTWRVLVSTVELSPTGSGLVESVAIFDNLPLFAGLFGGWLLVLFILLFTRTGSQAFLTWEKLALVLVFITVYLGFWTLITPLGRGDVISNLGHVRYVQEYGWAAATSNNYLTGFDFPGIYFVILAISTFTGIDIFGASAIFILSCHLLLALLLYVLFVKTLRNIYIAALGVVLAVVGNVILTGLYSFHIVLSVPFLLCFLIILNRQEAALFSSKWDIALVSVFFMAATETHFVTSMAIIFILIGIWVIHKLKSKRMAGTLSTFSPWLLLIMITFSVGYQVLWAVRTMKMLASFIPIVIHDLLSGELFVTMSMLWKANMSQKAPLWASLIRTFWLSFVYALGTAVALVRMFWSRKLAPVEIKEIGALAGIGVMAAIAILLSPQGNQFHRFIMYGSIIIVPIILRFFLSVGERWRQSVLACLAVLCLLLTFPTFLVHNGSISTSAFYPHEAAAGEFLETSYKASGNLTTFSVSIESGAKLVYLYLPEDPTKSPPLYTAMENEAGFWQEIDPLVDTFVNWKDTAPDVYPNWGGAAIFISSELMKLPYQHILGVSPDGPKWQELEEQLLQGGRVYDNGNLRIYVPR